MKGIIMSAYFEKKNNELCLCYFPAYGSDYLLQKFERDEKALIKKSFLVSKQLLRHSDEEDVLKFCIGSVGKEYTSIAPKVIRTNHQFFFFE